MSSYQSGPELRIGDSEREAAVAALGDHYAAGRLTKEEYDERSARAWEAKTRSALWPLFSDLPHPQVQRPSRESSGSSSGAGRRPGGGPPRWGWRFGLMPVLAVVLLIGLLTHFWLFPLILLGFAVFKFSQYRGYSRRQYHHQHHYQGWR